MGIRKLRLAAATCALITMSGCTTSDGSKPSKLPPVSNSAGASTSSAPKLTAEQEAIVSQYKAYFEETNDLVGASKAVVFETLTNYAWPVVVETTYEGLQAFNAQGQRGGGQIVFGELVPVVTGDAAEFEECRDTSTETVVSMSTGEVIGRGSPGTLFWVSFHLDPDGKWRIADSTVGAAEC